MNNYTGRYDLATQILLRIYMVVNIESIMATLKQLY
jgi:hypothetical protein